MDTILLFPKCRLCQFLLGLCLCLSLLVGQALAAQLELTLTPEQLRTPGVYQVGDDNLVSVGMGRIATSVGVARADRLAGEQALRHAKGQLARHLYKNEMGGPGKYSVSIGGARIVHREKHDGRIYIALLANPTQVALIPHNPLEDFQEVRIAPIVEELLTRAPNIADGGATVFDVADGWAGLGVGYAALPEKFDTESIDKSRIVARTAAHEALTAFIFGMRVNTLSTQQELYATGHGHETFNKWIKNSIREEVSGMLHSAQVAGEWVTTDHHIGVAVLIAQPAIDIALDFDSGEVMAQGSEEPAGYKEHLLYKSDIALEWQSNLWLRPWVLSGGVTLCSHKGRLYTLAVESAQLKGNAAYDKIQLPTILDAKARSLITRYLIGFSTKSVASNAEEQYTDLSKEVVVESLNKISREGVAGVVAGIQRLGSWYSEDEKTLFQAFIVPLP